MPLRLPRTPDLAPPPAVDRAIAAAEFAQELSEVEVQEWLEPIGNTGFYQSPLEPVDPWDCDRWPDSPYCEGSQPFNPDFINLVPQFTRNRCETCITIAPTLARLSLPPYTICKRSNDPACTPQVPVPPDPPELGAGAPYQKRCKDGSYHYIGTNAEMTVYGQTFPIGTEYYTIAVAVFQGQLREYEEEWSGERPWRSAVNFGPSSIGRYLSNGSAIGSSFSHIRLLNGEMSFNQIVRDRVLISGTNWSGYYTAKPSGEQAEFSTSMSIASIIFFDVPGCDQVPEAPPTAPVPAPPYHPEEWCCMSCCENAQENTELLRLIARRLGTDQFPASVPKNLLANREQGQQQIESLTELTAWFIQQIEGVVGQFPMEIEITDTDPTQKGDQKESVVVPNIAEALSELYGLALKNSVDSDVAVSFLMRLASETISAKNAALVAQDYARANAQFLGYKGNAVKRKIPYAFNPEGLDSLETILRESEKYLVGWQNEDNDTLIEYQQRLMFAAGIIKAVFFRGQKNISDLEREINNLTQGPDNQDPEERWREYLRAINNADHRFNAGNVPKPKIKDLQVPEDVTKLPTQDPTQK